MHNTRISKVKKKAEKETFQGFLSYVESYRGKEGKILMLVSFVNPIYLVKIMEMYL